MRLVVQIPCYNEAETLAEVLADLPSTVAGFDEVLVLVVDDGSTDATAAVARDHGADRVVSHRANRGLAAAFLTGLETALEMGADVIVNTDGDHQYPGAAIPELVAPVLRGEADLVVGDRDPSHDSWVSASKRLFYRIGDRVVRSVTGLDVRDAPSGFRAFSRDFAFRIYLTNAFSYTLETLFLASDYRAPVRQIKVKASPSRRPSRLFGSMRGYLSRSVAIIMRAYAMHNPMRAFAWLSTPFLLVGFSLGMRFLYYFIQNPDRSGHIQSLILAAISTVVGAQIFIFGMLGDLVRTNRLLLQEILVRARRIELGGSASDSGSPGGPGSDSDGR